MKEILRPLERNSIGKCTAWDSSSTESNDLYSMHSPGGCTTRAVLIAWVLSLRRAKMHPSESQVIFLKFESKSVGHQFIYVMYKGSYIFRQFNYIRAVIYRILTINSKFTCRFIPMEVHPHDSVQMLNYYMFPQKATMLPLVPPWQDLSEVPT